MIYIFYTKLSNRLEAKTFDYYFKQLPPAFQDQIIKYRNWQDGQRSLLGKALLIKGLQYLAINSLLLSDIKFTKYRKPYFNDTVDFNISHSGEYIICAISMMSKIGIDIEEIKEIPVEDFDSEFSADELKKIYNSGNPLYSFYSYWTKKEAFIKAIGLGLNTPLNKIAINHNRISWEKQEWFLHEIELDHRYVLHLAANIPNPRIELKAVHFQ